MGAGGGGGGGGDDEIGECWVGSGVCVGGVEVEEQGAYMWRRGRGGGKLRRTGWWCFVLLVNKCSGLIITWRQLFSQRPHHQKYHD